jgi:hypothetical protein
VVVGEPISEDRTDQLKRYLRDDGTVLYVLQDAHAAPGLAKIMERGQPLAEEAATRDYAMLGEIDFSHPLFAPFADPRFSDFTKIHFWRYRRLHIEENSPTRVLARFDSGDPALLERTVGSGRLLILTSSWRPKDSQLALSSKFVPLLAGMLERSGGEPRLPYYEVSQPVALTDEQAGSGERTVHKPDGAEVGLPAGARVFEGTDQPGVYSVASSGTERQFAVNLAASESKTAPLELDELEQRRVRLRRQPARADEREQRRQMRDAELESRQKLWRWLLAMAMAVVIGETWLAGRLARPATEEPGATT